MFSLLKKLLYPKTKGEKIDLTYKKPQTFTTVVTPQFEDVGLSSWRSQFHVGKGFTPFNAYDFKDKTIEELNAMHKEEVIRSAQKQLPQNYKVVTNELNSEGVLKFIHS